MSRERLLWSDDTDAWGIEFCPGEGGDYWANQWAVRRERGWGSTIAVFEFPDHAEAFVRAFGPRGEVAWLEDDALQPGTVVVLAHNLGPGEL